MAFATGTRNVIPVPSRSVIAERASIDKDQILELLDRLETPTGIQASTHLKFRGSVVARDALEMCLDLVDLQPERVRRIALSLARHIGLQTINASEEEEGKIFHEYRQRDDADAGSAEVFDFLSPRWGGTKTEFTYFGSMDSTPLYLVLIEKFVRQHGDALLWEEFSHHETGQSMRVIETVVMAAEFVARKIEESDLGLFEYVRLNKAHGLWFQSNRDASETLVLPDGTVPNIDANLALFELQPIARRGLRAAASLVIDPGLRERWRALADLLIEATVDRFWDRRQSRFGRAIHRDKWGRAELLFMRDSASAETLRDDPFVGFEGNGSEKYVSSIVESLYEHLVTNVGFRMQSLEHGHHGRYWSYGGAHVIFPAVTKRIAEGLYVSGLHELGRDADRRLLRGCQLAGGFPDVHFVNDAGQLLEMIVDVDVVPDTNEVVSATSPPMLHQGWTATAALSAGQRNHRNVPPRARWRSDLVERVAERMQARAGDQDIDTSDEPQTKIRTWFDAAQAFDGENAFARRSGRIRNSAIVPLRPRPPAGIDPLE